MRKIILLLIIAGLFVTISDLGAVAQAADLDRPIWLLVLLADLCLVVLVYRLWKSQNLG